MIEQRRGKNLALTGAILQSVFTVVLLVIWLWTDSLAAMSTTWMLGAGSVLWLMAAVMFYCRQLERREAQELEELAAGGTDTATIFADDSSQLKPAAARAAAMRRWAVPIFTLAWAVAHTAIGLATLRYLLSLHRGPALQAEPAGAIFAVLVTFLAFLFSRYATGMGSEVQWRMLRTTGSYMLVSVLAVAGVAAALLFSTQGYGKVDMWIALAVPGLQLVLAAELVVNLVLDLYRPRVPGREDRLSFDSRLFNLISQPGRVGHSIADTLNYQFGFEVSSTWFYQLLSRAMMPLILLGAMVLLAMSSIVIVNHGYESVVTTLGRADTETLKPGIHLKWPWPFAKTRKFDTGQVHEILLGAGELRDERLLEQSFVGRHRLNLWTTEHGDRQELDFLIAKPADQDIAAAVAEGKGAPPVNVIKLVVSVHFRVKDPLAYGYRARDTKKLLEYIAYREMVRYCASATLMTPVGDETSQRPSEIMTRGRGAAAAALKQRIQAAADQLDLGAEIVNVDLLTVHPPADVAPAFQAVLSAERRQDEKRYVAQARSNRILSEVAGTPEDAMILALAIRARGDLKKLIAILDKPDEIVRYADASARTLREDLKVLNEEISRQEMLGQPSRGSRTYRNEIEAHLTLLGEISADPQNFDFAARLVLADAKADSLFAEVVGKPAGLIARAISDRWTKELTERARYESYQRELIGYEACPQVYLVDKWLEVWDDALPNIMKYILAVDRDSVEVWLNWERDASTLGGIYQNPEALGK